MVERKRPDHISAVSPDVHFFGNLPSRASGNDALRLNKPKLKMAGAGFDSESGIPVLVCKPCFPLGTVNVDDQQVVDATRGNAELGGWPLSPPVPYLPSILRRGFETSFGQGLLVLARENQQSPCEIPAKRDVQGEAHLALASAQYRASRVMSAA